MQIIIPMSGFGERFKAAGYDVPKFLIPLEGKPIIAHVIDLFPKETNFIFICNQEHIEHFPVRETLKHYCPSGKIITIASHKKGPVHTVLSAREAIDPSLPTIVNYCDFTCYWNYPDFKSWVQKENLDAALPAYRGFHPHSLAGNYYAYIKEHNMRALDIQEKKPFTANPMQEFASTGTYYFRNGALMLECFEEAIEQGLSTNNEYYVSLAYKPLFKKKTPVGVYEIEHFMQWGTPQDVAEYQYWSDAFRAVATQKPFHTTLPGNVLIPMAGLGERFSKAGYALPKPLIPVNNNPMVIEATHALPPAANYIFALRSNMPGYETISHRLKQDFPHSSLVTLPGVTEGQAHTCLLACGDVPDDTPLTISACDNGMVLNEALLAAQIQDSSIDVIVWVAKGLPGAYTHPEMYSWVVANGRDIRAISVKKPLEKPECDPIVIGTFTFKRAADFKACATRLMESGKRVNNEFYVDSCINEAIQMGLRCQLFEVDTFLCWGTPNELETFRYWQSCFHKWPAHCYTANKLGGPN